jgi:UDP-N-acetylmuramate dehydrogenase
VVGQCGLKGDAVGGAQVSLKHAGFLINNGGTSKDFVELMEKVQEIVGERAGVKLEPEIRILGEEAK